MSPKLFLIIYTVWIDKIRLLTTVSNIAIFAQPAVTIRIVAIVVLLCLVGIFYLLGD